MSEFARARDGAQVERFAHTLRHRARRLYDTARAIEARTPDAVCQELAREIALLALDLLAEARGAGAQTACPAKGP